MKTQREGNEYAMKKWGILLSLLLAVSMLFACGKDPTPEVEAAATGFLEGIKNADAEQIRQFSTENVMNDEDLEIFDADKIEEIFLQILGIEKSILDAPAAQQLDAFCEKLSKNYLTDYTIGDISGEDGVMTVEAEVTYGYSKDMILPGKQINEQMKTFLEQYQKENGDALLTIYQKEGEEAMNRKIYNDLIPQTISAMTGAIENADPLKEKIVLTVRKVEKEWKVTEMAAE